MGSCEISRRGSRDMLGGLIDAEGVRSEQVEAC